MKYRTEVTSHASLYKSCIYACMYRVKSNHYHLSIFKRLSTLREVFSFPIRPAVVSNVVDGILPFVDVGAKQPASKEALKEGVIEFDEVLRTKNNIPFGVMNNSERNIVFFAVAPKTRFR